MYLKLMLAALSVGLLSSTTVPAQEAGSVVVKTIVNTLKNDAGQPISFPRGHLELTVLSFDIPVGARLPVHKHKGQRYAYVLQGDLRVEQRPIESYEVVQAGGRHAIGERRGEDGVQ